MYFNRSKPPNCGNCGFSLGGSFISKKRVKQNNPLLVEICNGVYSCRTSGPDDRCFVTSDGANCWMCTREQCKVLRSVHVNTGLTEHFQCDHVKQLQDSSNADPLATFNVNLPSYPCSNIVRNQLHEIIASLPSKAPPVVQVSEKSYAVFGLPTACNPLGFCHVKKETKCKSGFSSTGKNCRNYAAKSKGCAVKACCLHLHLLFTSLQQFAPLPALSSSSSVVATSATEGIPPSSLSPSSPFVVTPQSASTAATPSVSATPGTSWQRQSTVILAEKCRKLPYKIPRELLCGIMIRDSCSPFGVQGSWPKLFCTTEEICGSPLGPAVNHPGQQSYDTYLITEFNPFLKVDVMEKICTSKDCHRCKQVMKVLWSAKQQLTGGHLRPSKSQAGCLMMLGTT